ncbi:Transcription elongation factor spt6 [Microbotryomycetes sp. JL221]|nr:Transcription elongation factor spt6 [Microbotryomycetes sp. JL221]
MSSAAARDVANSTTNARDRDGDVDMNNRPSSQSHKTDKRRANVDEREDEDEDEEDDEDDERGIDLMGDNTGDEDSSEEEDDDSEEERRVRKDFIVDEDEIAERKRRKKQKRRERKQREREAREAAGDDNDGEGSRKRRKDSDDENGDLDEDDLALLEENTGVRLTHKKPKLKRLRRRKSVEQSDSERSDRSARQGLNRIFSEDEDEGDGGLNDFEDEMAGFIEDDTQSESGAGSDEDEEARAARRAQRKRERKKGRRAGLGGAPIEGISQEDWQEVTDVFGNGQDYAFALESDDEAEKDNHKELKDIFEPSEIASRMLTEADDIVRRVDIPERMQLQSSSIKPPQMDDEGNLLPYIAVDDIPAAAEWISTRLGQRIAEQFLLKNANDEHSRLYEPFMTSLKTVIKFLNVEFWEVPYIVQNKADYLVHTESADESVDGAKKPPRQLALLRPSDLWNVEQQSIKYRAFADRRKELQDLFKSLNVEGTNDEDDYFEECFDNLETIEQVGDLSEWLSTRYATKLQEMRDDREREERAALENEGLPARKKRATRESAYDIAKKSSIAKFAEVRPSLRFAYKFPLTLMMQLASPSSSSVGRGFAQGLKIGQFVDPEQSPTDLAETYSGYGTNYSTADSALAAGKLILVHELSRDPTLKRNARRYFVDYANVSVLPTERGRSKIDEFHPFFAFKYLNNKPLNLLQRSSQFLQILSAEKEGLVECRIRLPEQALTRFMDQMKEVYLDEDTSSSVGESWNTFRQSVLDAAFHDHLIPGAEQWARTWLLEEEEQFVGEVCADKLYHRINVSPYCRQDGTMDVGDVPSVLAISHGQGDPKRDDTTMIYLDSEGYLREHAKVGDLSNLSSTDQETLTELLKRRRPQVVVIGGFSPNTKRLRENFERLAGDVSIEIVKDELDQDDEEPVSQGELDKRAKFETIYVHDDVARIFSNSERGSTEFPELSRIAKYCIGLARFAQSPLHEYASLGSDDLVAISYDPAQKFVSPNVLRLHLERALIEIVNNVGVDINRAVRNQYYAALLPFVSGLGPRKADYLLKTVTRKVGGTLSTRDSLVNKGVLGKNIFINVASFLRIPQDDLELDLGRERDQGQEVLDDTRIHPEDYALARKMASDALEYDEEDLDNDGENPSKIIVELMDKDTSKLDELSLDDFAIELQRMMNEPKRLKLYMIRDELKRPYHDNRPSYLVPDARSVFTMLTGETDQTLRPHLIVPARVLRTMSDGGVMCRLDSGMIGIVSQEYASQNTPRVGQTIQATVIDIDHDKLEVKLANHEDILSRGDLEHRQVRPDAFYDIAAANAEKSAQSVVDKRAGKAGARKRVINHPAFQNVDSGAAEQILAHMQRGDCIIRPSSKEDHLAVTWKIADGVYQHLAVAELNKADEFSLGSRLKVGNHIYSDLDELLAVHIRSLAAKAGEMISHDKFKGTQQELEAWLRAVTTADPGKSFYGFCFHKDHRKAGEFQIGARADHQSEIVYFSVYLKPGAFVFNERPAANMVELTNAFKLFYMQQAASNPAPRPTGKTPLHPSLAGGRTPGGRTPSGRTPHGGLSTAGFAGGRTPDPRMMYGGGTTPSYGRGNGTPMYNGAAAPQAGYPGYPAQGRPQSHQQYTGR